MDELLRDPRFATTTFVVIDFEGLTPAGRPPEPIEVAALTLRPAGSRLQEVGRFEELMRPPADVPVTARDVRLKGITQTMLSTAAPAAEVMARLDAHLTAPPYRLVAHHASTEAGIISRQAAHCPVLAATPLLDTLRLAKTVLPSLGSYGTESERGDGAPCWSWTWRPACSPGGRPPPPGESRRACSEPDPAREPRKSPGAASAGRNTPWPSSVERHDTKLRNRA
ncbi:PolC-type DNA polymerase III [Streptomyces roseolus]|uniref:PolC-type DNA polymerase III n=1 Tax=Streptomyces roseolus TaxID=67358 RepID=UPI0037B47724